MAAEADTIAAVTLNGRYQAAAVAAAAVVASLSPQSQQQSHSPLEPPAPLMPPTPPLVTTLPPLVTCTFVGEGSANAVFKVIPKKKKSHAGNAIDNARNSDSDAEPLSTHLLRIPKAGPGVGPGTCLDHHAYYSAVLRPLLGAEWLVGQHLVQGVVSTGVCTVLNGLLADLDRSEHRRPDWVGTRASADVDVALLVEDMTLASDESLLSSTTTTIQCKPKWLVQSPSAPAGARRCRTCALSAASAAPSSNGLNGNGTSKVNGAKRSHKIKPCPLVLVADPPTTAKEEADLEAALWEYIYQHLGSIAASSSSASSSPLNSMSSSASISILKARPAIIRWLRTTNLFRRVAAIQAEFDSHGALSVDLRDGDATASLGRLQTAMTLRDCTCYLRVTIGEGGSGVSVSAKLGDLDRKDGRLKLPRWQAQERALLAGGFYLGTEEPRRQTNCWLERQRA